MNNIDKKFFEKLREFLHKEIEPYLDIIEKKMLCRRK